MSETTMSDIKLILTIAIPIFAVLVTYLTASSFYDVVPARNVAIWTQFQRVKYNETSGPGFHWKMPFTKGIHMFTGPDKDEVSYTCGTKDGITFQGKVAITNRLLPENVLESYLIHGKQPDRANIYDMSEFLMQSICAEMTAREFLVDKFTDIDDLLYAALVEAQVKAKSGLLIVPGKVKVFKPQPTNSDIANIIKKEAEHRQSTKTADEKQKLDKKMAALAAAKQAADDQLARDRNKAEQQRISDSQETELARKKRLIEAEKERQAIQHEMDRAKAKKEADIKVMSAKADKDAGLELAKKNDALLKEPYLRALEIEALAQNNKIYYGSDLKHVFRLKQQD